MCACVNEEHPRALDIDAKEMRTKSCVVIDLYYSINNTREVCLVCDKLQKKLNNLCLQKRKNVSFVLLVFAHKILFRGVGGYTIVKTTHFPSIYAV